MNEDEKETTPVVAPTTLMDDHLVEVAERAEKRVEAVKKIKTLALRVTNHHDWVDQNGKPYLQVSGAEKIARLFGISWQLEPPLIEFEDDGHFTWTFKGSFSMGTAEIEAIGTRSSKDAFFSRAHEQDIPVSEIDRGDVKKAAFTNCIGNGITRLLGLRNLTWEQVQEGGVDRMKAGKVQYRNGLTIPYGKEHKGKALNDATVPDDFLVWLVGTLDEAIKDPKKASYKTKNEALRAAIDMELKRRESPGPGEPEPDYDKGESTGAAGPSHEQADLDTLAADYRARIREAKTTADATSAYNEMAGDSIMTVSQVNDGQKLLKEKLAAMGKGKR